VDRIDKIAPVATSLTYSTSSATNGTVLATLTLSETGNVAGWDAEDATTFTKTFTDNFSGTVSFTDLVGNAGQT
jgi:ethanolamine utilization microcompartment shell protein EutS